MKITADTFKLLRFENINLKFIFCFFFIGLGIVYSQKVKKQVADKGFFWGQSYLIYDNDSYLYKKASYDSKIVKAFSAGDEIEVVELTNIPSGRGTNSGVYLKVKTADNKIGFVSSTDLALGFFVAKNGAVIMYQKQRHVEETLLHFNRLNKDGKVVDLGVFTYEKPDFSLSFYGDRDLPLIDHIISLEYQLYDCESSLSTTYLSLALDKNELLSFAKLKNYCPDDKSSTYQTIIFPDEDNGVNDGVVYYSEKKVLVDEKHKAHKMYIYTRVYKWASGTLEEPIIEYYW
jgi:hypothetical protein